VTGRRATQPDDASELESMPRGGEHIEQLSLTS
jgi:hypothetical protein